MSSRNRGVAHRRGWCARRPAVALTGTHNEKDNGSAPSGIGDHVSTREVMGGPVRILDAGSGPVIVCCSGVASTLWDWLPVVERLRRDHRVIVYDRPGYAQGDRVSEQLPDLDEEAHRFAAVLTVCGVREPVTAVGHSFGGAVVEAVARVHPERIRHLVLLDASVPSAEGADPAHDDAATARRFRRFTLPLARSRVAGAVWRVVGPVVAGRLVPGRGRLMRSWPQLRVDLTSPNFLMGSLRELAGYVACMNRLQELAAHTPLDPDLDVLVVAANGRLPRIGTTRWVRHVLARATYLSREAPVHTIVLRRSGHFVMVDHPERIAAVIASVRSGVLPAHG